MGKSNFLASMKNGKAKKYIALSDKYIYDSDVLLKAGDLSQASEKLWGAFATTVKAVAAKHNKQIKTHDGISFYVATISKELKDKSFLTTSVLADGLHQNFYENSLTADHVRESSKVVHRFVNRIKAHFFKK